MLPRINIDIGTKILKQKCFGCKTYVPDTFLGFEDCILHSFLRRFRISYSRGCRTSILMSFSKICMRTWIRRYHHTQKNEKTKNKTQYTHKNKQKTTKNNKNKHKTTNTTKHNNTHIQQQKQELKIIFQNL